MHLRQNNKIAYAQFGWALLSVFAAALVIGLIAAAVFIVLQSTQAAGQTLHPPHLPLTKTPLDVGIRTYLNVTFRTQDGMRLSGWYAAPQPDNGRVIILAHGYAQNRQNLLPEAGILAQNGIGVLLFDFRGHGASDAAMVTIGDRERLDLRAAVDFVSKQPGVTYIGELGFSMGAAALAGAAAQDAHIRAVVLEASFPSLQDELYYRSRFFGPLSQIPTLLMFRQAGVNIEQVSPLHSLCAISPRPVY
ncbi:MAG: alpha/beta fold hydrolase [Anaerolineaceae bacterium]|nr:alpha/beta fold hydrolase [Anaerolineaceae bacterium]